MTNIGISEVSIDYFEHRVLGRFDAIFFTLTRGAGLDIDAQVRSLDEQIGANASEEGAQINIPKAVQTPKMALAAMFRLRKFDRIKILGAGGAINSAVSVALMLTQGRLSKVPVGIEAIGFAPVKGREGEAKMTTGISIYLRKNYATQFSTHHVELLEQLKTG